MRRWVGYSFVALLVAALAACGGGTTTPMNLSVSTSAEEGTAPFTVDFTAQVTGGAAPLTFSWDFGDGGTAGEQNPSHTFEQAGEYTVTCTATDAGGKSASAGTAVVVYAPLQAQAAANLEQGLAPLLVRFSGSATGGLAPYAYHWDFGDGEAADGESASHLFALAGSFEVVLTVSDALGNESQDTLTVTVADDQVPVAAITASPTSGPAPLTVDFRATVVGGDAPYGYSWDFGDGSSDDTDMPQHTFVQPGSYNVLLAVSDADGDEAHAAVTITVSPDSQPVVSIAAEPASGLAPLQVQFSATVSGGDAPLQYQWDFGDGTTSSEPAPSHLYAQDGDFTASLTVTDADGDDASAQVTISAIAPETPVVTAAANPETGPVPLLVAFTCTVTGGSPPYDYLWDFGDGNTSSAQNPSHTYTAIGDYQASCTVTDQFGQRGQGSVAVSAQDANQPPVIDALTVANGWDNTTQTCAAVAQTMMQLQVDAHDDNGDILTYRWSFDTVPAGSIAQFNNPEVMNPTFVPDLAGDYLVRVRVEDGRGGVTSQTVSITAEPAGAVQAVAPLQPATGAAGEPYPEELTVRLTTQCGIPYRQGRISWSASNGLVTGTSGPSDDQGLILAQVELGCDIAAPAEFTAFLPEDPDQASFSIPVEAGPATMLFIEAERDVPLHDAAGNPQPMQVEVRLADRCGNQASGQDVTFALHTEPNNSACFNDLCPGAPGNGSGVKDLAFQSTSGGSASFQLYSTAAGSVYVWADSLSQPGLPAGGMRVALRQDFEAGDGGFVPWSTAGDYLNEWAWGQPSAGPGAAHSGNNVWATVLDGDYHAASGEDVRYLFAGIDLPCSPAIYLSFWEYHQLGPDALLYLSLNDPLYGQYPAPADGASAYDGSLNGRQGYQADSGGWRQVRFDLSPWSCGWAPLLWNLYLDGAGSTGFGWAIDDVRVEYFDPRAEGTFRPGPAWDGQVWGSAGGVAGCDTSPAQFYVEAWDRWGNFCTDTEVQVSSDGAGTRQFVDARDGWLVSQAGGDATVNLGPWGWTYLWLTDDQAETVDLTLLTGSGSNPNDGVVFTAASADEVDLCDDYADNDCDGDVDCADSDCLGHPACLPDLVADWHSASFLSGRVRYDFNVCNYNAVDINGTFEVAVYLKRPGDPAPGYPDDGVDLLTTRVQGGLPGWSCWLDGLDITGLPPGDYALWFVVDWTDSVTEADKSNNVAAFPALVTVPAGGVESEDQANCLDAADNDLDGRQDCEDNDAPAGQVACGSAASSTCDNDADTRLGFDEPCNGSDDFGFGAVDVFACSCVNDAGCDDIDPVFPYRCFTELAPLGYVPVCSPPCNAFNPPDDVCLWLSGGALGRCNVTTGVCEP